MPRVLLLAYHFPPTGTGGVGRALSLARHLPDHGWDVTVLAAPPHAGWPRDDSLLAALPAAVNVVRVRPLDFRPNRSRTIEHRELTFLWLLPALAKARRILRDQPHDVILATAPPPAAHAVAARASRQFGIPWVADFRDPWGVRAPGLFRAFRRRRHLAGAAAVVAVNGTLRRHLESDLGCRATTIHNGFEPEEIPRDVERIERRAVFLGTLSEFNRFDTLYEVLAGSGGEYLHIGASRRYDLAQRTRHLKQGRFRSTGYLPRATALREAATGSVYLLSLRDDLSLALSTKTFDYIGLGGPILCVGEEGAAADFVRQNELGLCVPHDDGKAIEQALQKLWASRERYPESLGKKFTRAHAAAQMSRILEDVLRAR